MAPEALTPDEEYQRKVRPLVVSLFSIAKLNNLQIVGVNSETVTNVTSTDFPGHYPGEDHAWSLDKFKRVRNSLCLHKGSINTIF